MIENVFGIALAVIGLSIILHPNSWKNYVGLFNKIEFLFLGGAVALVMGSAMVIYHNTWDSLSEGIVSFLGWITLVKSLFLLLTPRWAMKAVIWYKNLKHIVYSAIGGIYLIIGLFLLFT